MIYASGAAGPPGYGGISEDSVGEQKPPDDEQTGHRTPGDAGGPEGKAERDSAPSEHEQPLDTGAIVERPLGVPVDQTE